MHLQKEVRSVEFNLGLLYSSQALANASANPFMAVFTGILPESNPSCSLYRFNKLLQNDQLQLRQDLVFTALVDDASEHKKTAKKYTTEN